MTSISVNIDTKILGRRVNARGKLQFSESPEEGDINTHCLWQVEKRP